MRLNAHVPLLLSLLGGLAAVYAEGDIDARSPATQDAQAGAEAGHSYAPDHGRVRRALQARGEDAAAGDGGSPTVPKITVNGGKGKGIDPQSLKPEGSDPLADELDQIHKDLKKAEGGAGSMAPPPKPAGKGKKPQDEDGDFDMDAATDRSDMGSDAESDADVASRKGTPSKLAQQLRPGTPAPKAAAEDAEMPDADAASVAGSTTTRSRATSNAGSIAGSTTTRSRATSDATSDAGASVKSGGSAMDVDVSGSEDESDGKPASVPGSANSTPPGTPRSGSPTPSADEGAPKSSTRPGSPAGKGKESEDHDMSDAPYRRRDLGSQKRDTASADGVGASYVSRREAWQVVPRA